MTEARYMLTSTSCPGWTESADWRLWFDTASALPTTRSLSTTPVAMGGQYSKDKSIAGRDHDQ
jgi:hypothetical protein